MVALNTSMKSVRHVEKGIGFEPSVSQAEDRFLDGGFMIPHDALVSPQAYLGDGLLSIHVSSPTREILLTNLTGIAWSL